MLKRVMKLLSIVLLVFAVIVIGDDETRHSLKRKVGRMLNRDTSE